MAYLGCIKRDKGNMMVIRKVDGMVSMASSGFFFPYPLSKETDNDNLDISFIKVILYLPSAA